MRRARRLLIAASLIAVPFAGAAAGPADATCRPEKPSTCETRCPDGWENFRNLCLPTSLIDIQV